MQGICLVIGILIVIDLIIVYSVLSMASYWDDVDGKIVPESVLDDLPSAQPVDKDIIVPCTDAISRQVAERIEDV